MTKVQEWEKALLLGNNIPRIEACKPIDVIITDARPRIIARRLQAMTQRGL